MNFEELKLKEIFKVVPFKTLECDGKLSNLLDVSNDVIFAWSDKDGCLYTQGIRSGCTSCQQLQPTQRPEFTVRNVSVNESGTRAVLWGPAGVSVMDLPWRCGPKLEFQDGKSHILTACKTINQLEMPYDVQVVQVRWHPCTTYDSSMIILLSDNSVCHFDAMPHFRVNIFRVGSRPLSRQKTLAALGETAVDFCFPPIFFDLQNQPNECTLLVVRGNGDVMLVSSGNTDDNEGQVLPISPLPQDNCLNDACAVLIMPGKPPAVIIATTSGVIYHTFLVPLDADQVDEPPNRRKYRLLVVESVAIDGGLLSNPDDVDAIPLRLILDTNHPRRYFIIHACGVYSVQFNAARGVQDLMEKSEFPAKMPSSVVEYLICTGNTLLGVVAIPYTLVAFDSEGNVSTAPLRRFDLQPIVLFTPQDDDSPDKILLEDQLKQPYQEKIERLLQESHVMPLFTFPKSDISLEQLLALFVRIGDVLRQVTIPRYRQVRILLNQRIKLIQTLKDLQMKELQSLEASRAEIQLAAENFAEKVQTVSDLLEEHKERVHRIVRQVAEVNPGLTKAEMNLQNTLTEIEGNLKLYETGVEKLKKNSAYQDLKIANEEEGDAPMSMSNKQIATIHECLSLIGNNVANLVQRVNDMNDLVLIDK